MLSAEAGLQPPQPLQPMRRQCFALGNTDISIRPSITLAETADLQKNFSKDKKNEKQTNQRDSDPRIPPLGKDKGTEFLAKFPNFICV